MKKEALWHILFWIIYTAIFTFVEGGYSNNFDISFYIELGFLPFRLSVAYLNYFWLLPRFLLNRNIVQYIFYTLICIAIAGFLHRSFMYFYLNEILFPNWNQESFPIAYKLLQSSVIITSPMIFLIGLVVIKRWVSSERKAEQFENEKIKAELDYLRSQINPHFFFNTLNTLYGLSLKKSEKTPEVVMKLSELMSYVLYDSDKDSVLLTEEIDQMERYISLEQIRYENRFHTEIEVTGDPEFFRIPPLILLPFLENSFKHGVNKSSKDGWISIRINVSQNTLMVSIKNKIFGLADQSNTGRNGLGIFNVQKRLSLIYPQKHSLLCEEQDGMFVVELTIQNEK
ncbi:MAG: histidine kinase [Ekhidna sp.]